MPRARLPARADLLPSERSGPRAPPDRLRDYAIRGISVHSRFVLGIPPPRVRADVDGIVIEGGIESIPDALSAVRSDAGTRAQIGKKVLSSSTTSPIAKCELGIGGKITCSDERASRAHDGLLE